MNSTRILNRIGTMAQGDFKLVENGVKEALAFTTKRFSMLPYLQYPAFRTLSEPGKFALAHVSNSTVEWTDEIDMSPDTLYIAGQAM